MPRQARRRAIPEAGPRTLAEALREIERLREEHVIFWRAVRHDVRTPLQAIRAATPR